MALYAPRDLKEPHFWRFSHLKYTSIVPPSPPFIFAPRISLIVLDVTTGVICVTPLRFWTAFRTSEKVGRLGLAEGEGRGGRGYCYNSSSRSKGFGLRVRIYFEVFDNFVVSKCSANAFSIFSVFKKFSFVID